MDAPGRIYFKAKMPTYELEETPTKILRLAREIFATFIPPIILLEVARHAVHHLLGKLMLKERERFFNPTTSVNFNSMGAIPLSLTTPDGKVLDGKYIKSEKRNKDSKTVIIFNGKGERYEEKSLFNKYVYDDESILVPRENLYNFLNDGYDVVVFNYRGVSESTGWSSCDGLKLDAETVYQFVRDKLEVPDEKIVLWGFSLGGSIATFLASKHPVSLINVRSFSSLSHVVRYHATCIAAFILILLDWCIHPAADWRKVKGKKIVVYHPDDPIIPLYCSLFKWVESATAHITLKSDKAYFEEICRAVPEEKRADFIHKLKKDWKITPHSRTLSDEEMSNILSCI